jgi:hypothetical protein
LPGRARATRDASIAVVSISSERARRVTISSLHRQEIGAARVELGRPKMRPSLGADELGIDAHLVAALPRAPFQHVAHAELPADLCHVDGLALLGEGRAARDDEAAADAREAAGELVGDDVGEIVLRGVATQVREGQDDD